MRPLVIIGAGGHGRVVADIAKLCGYHEIIFLDDAEIEGVSGKVCDYIKYIQTSDFIVGIGNNAIREKIYQELSGSKAEIVTLIHPKAVVAEQVKHGRGTVVMAGAVINVGTLIGDGVVVNTNSSIDHDCVVEDFCHVSVGASLCGTVKIGRQTMIGAGATVINNVVVCEGCVIGAGATVIQDIKEKGTYIGVPAKIR